MADPDRRGEHRAAVLEQKRDVRSQRRSERQEQSQDHRWSPVAWRKSPATAAVSPWDLARRQTHPLAAAAVAGSRSGSLGEPGVAWRGDDQPADAAAGVLADVGQLDDVARVDGPAPLDLADRPGVGIGHRHQPIGGLASRPGLVANGPLSIEPASARAQRPRRRGPVRRRAARRRLCALPREPRASRRGGRVVQRFARAPRLRGALASPAPSTLFACTSALRARSSHGPLVES
jgi:hypothetical protein